MMSGHTRLSHAALQSQGDTAETLHAYVLQIKHTASLPCINQHFRSCMSHSYREAHESSSVFLMMHGKGAISTLCCSVQRCEALGSESPEAEFCKSQTVK